MELSVTKELIFNFFADNCSAFQKRLIEKWLQEEANRELFYLWLGEWEKRNLQYEVDVEAGLSRHRKWVSEYKRGQTEDFVERPVRPTFGWKYGLVAAGIVSLVLATGLFFGDNIQYKTYRTSFGEVLDIRLSDDSRVTLNADSELKVPRFLDFREVRTVNLRGEATFEVARKPNRRKFIIDTGDQTEIEVLGTVFNVYNRLEEKRIALAEGKVQVNYLDPSSEKRSITLKPGELATLNNSGQVDVRKAESQEAHFGWKDNRFVFDSLTFEQVGKRIKEIFGTPVIFSDSNLAKQAISGTFTASAPEEILDILRHGGNFQYQKDKGTFNIMQSPPTH